MKELDRLGKFWSLVVEEVTPRLPGISPCWMYIGKNSSGYGKIGAVFAHRMAAAIYTVAIPSRVIMRCGNRRCVRRDHLCISLLSNRPPKLSKRTGRVVPLPVWKNQEVIDEVLKLRKRVPRPNTRKMARLCKCSELTVKKILAEAALYDVIDEVKKCITDNTPYCTTPYKFVGELSMIDSCYYNMAIDSLILSKGTSSRSFI